MMLVVMESHSQEQQVVSDGEAQFSHWENVSAVTVAQWPLCVGLFLLCEHCFDHHHDDGNDDDDDYWDIADLFCCKKGLHSTCDCVFVQSSWL